MAFIDLVTMIVLYNTKRTVIIYGGLLVFWVKGEFKASGKKLTKGSLPERNRIYIKETYYCLVILEENKDKLSIQQRQEDRTIKRH